MDSQVSTLFTRKNTLRRERRARALSEAVRSPFEPLEPRQLMSVDLTGMFVTAPMAAQGGTRQSVVLNIQNVGTSNARGSVQINVYAVPAGTTTFDPATATLLTTVRRTGSLRPGDTVGTPIRVPITTGVVAGNTQLVALIDPNNRIADANLSNNVVQSSAFVVSQRNVDIVPSIAINTIPNLTEGTRGSARVAVKLTNAGTESLISGQSVGYQVVARPVGATGTSQDVVLTSSSARINMSNVGPTGSRTVAFTLHFPATLAAGTYNLVLRADPNNRLAETDETNNEATLATTITVAAAPSGSGIGNNGNGNGNGNVFENGGGLRNLKTGFLNSVTSAVGNSLAPVDNSGNSLFTFNSLANTGTNTTGFGSGNTTTGTSTTGNTTGTTTTGTTTTGNTTTGNTTTGNTTTGNTTGNTTTGNTTTGNTTTGNTTTNNSVITSGTNTTGIDTSGVGLLPTVAFNSGASATTLPANTAAIENLSSNLVPVPGLSGTSLGTTGTDLGTSALLNTGTNGLGTSSTLTGLTGTNTTF